MVAFSVSISRERERENCSRPREGRKDGENRKHNLVLVNGDHFGSGELKLRHLISHRGSQLFIGWFHAGPGGPHFDTSIVHRVTLLLLLEKVGQKRQLKTVEKG